MSDNRMEPATMDLSCQSSTHQPCSIIPNLTAWRQNISNPWTDSGRPPWLWPQSWGTFGWWEFDVLVQGSTNWCASALVKFVPSVARLVCLTLLGSFLTMLCRPFCASLYVCNGACRSTNSKLVSQKVKGQTVQGQMAQEFWLSQLILNAYCEAQKRISI